MKPKIVSYTKGLYIARINPGGGGPFTPAAAKFFYNSRNILAMNLIFSDFKDKSIRHILAKFQVINLFSS